MAFGSAANAATEQNFALANLPGNLQGDAYFGVRGVTDPSNHPASKHAAATWKTPDGGMWLFGGNGMSSYGSGPTNDLWKYDSSATLQWTWMGGSQLYKQDSTFGEKGGPTANNTPGARYGAASWTAKDGNLWLFGGYGYSSGTLGFRNDLWKYNVASGQWTWMHGSDESNQAGNYGLVGSPAPGNVPGARRFPITWVDADGALWLYGGNGYAATGRGYLGDLWKYDTVSNQWTWVNGSDQVDQNGEYATSETVSQNHPGARESAVSWTDQTGGLWLFGGFGFASSSKQANYLNDLWKFDPALNEWVWKNGSDQNNQVAVYGALGSLSPDNIPGARDAAAASVGPDGSLILFGGFGYGADQFGNLNDAWKFDPGAGEWAWIAGSSVDADTSGTYGVRGTPSVNNIPGARMQAATWTGNDGTMWLYGGQGIADGGQGVLNDLWHFNPVTHAWTWLDGADEIGRFPDYGSLGIPSSGISPGARVSPISWTGIDGSLWLFGGELLMGNNQTAISRDSSFMNDLWKYDPGSMHWTWIAGANQPDQDNVYGTKGIADASNAPGCRKGSASWRDAAGNLILFGGRGIFDDYNADLNDVWKFDTTSTQWTWIGGSNLPNQAGNYGTQGTSSTANIPQARNNGMTWTTPDGMCWLFGGWGEAGGCLNDLWKYDPASNAWTWVKGNSGSTNTPGVYGTQGNFNISNLPGARRGASTWTSADGSLWMFGGSGYGSLNGSESELNDLWKFDTVLSQWVWMGGSKTQNSIGVYGTQNVPDPANIPGARHSALTWESPDGSFCLFGGFGIPALHSFPIPSMGQLNDLWKFDPASNQWTWLKGSQYPNQPAVIGTPGVAASDNVPAARANSVGWVGDSEVFRMFTGTGELYDLWTITASTSAVSDWSLY